MTSSASFRRFAFAFGTTFAILYVVALARDVALFTVFPSLGVVLAGTHHTRDVADPAMGFLAPAVYWYGWAVTAALGALMLGFVAARSAGGKAILRTAQQLPLLAHRVASGTDRHGGYC
ncbi:MAG: hypothetical protein E6G70_03515 [Alphaproteobacteria bacterium]|nr:MAG: hypothetical protein E6G70_03515 [Alphaproteobacteria bacterium]